MCWVYRCVFCLCVYKFYGFCVRVCESVFILCVFVVSLSGMCVVLCSAGRKLSIYAYFYLYVCGYAMKGGVGRR